MFAEYRSPPFKKPLVRLLFLSFFWNICRLIGIKVSLIEVKQKRLSSKGGRLMDEENKLELFKSQDVMIKTEVRTLQDFEEAVPESLPSKVHFTVTIQRDLNDKFLEIMLAYQSKFPYGKVYKHYVLQLIIDEVHTRMKKQNLL